MPTYTVTVPEGRLSDAQKAQIAAAITRIHHEETGAPAYYAQVIVNEVRAGNYFLGGTQLNPAKTDQIFISGQIRGGRSAEKKRALMTRFIEAVAGAAKTQQSSIWVYITDLPANQMAEFGRILPEPGQEPAWTAALPDAERRRLQAIGSLVPGNSA